MMNETGVCITGQCLVETWLGAELKTGVSRDKEMLRRDQQTKRQVIKEYKVGKARCSE